MVNNKSDWQETSINKFKNLTAKEVLEWMEEASQFMQKLYNPNDFERIKKSNEGDVDNVRRTK